MRAVRVADWPATATAFWQTELLDMNDESCETQRHESKYNNAEYSIFDMNGSNNKKLTDSSRGITPAIRLLDRQLPTNSSAGIGGGGARTAAALEEAERWAPLH